MQKHTPPPGKPLLRMVRAKFTERGESLHGWCKANSIDWGYANHSLTGRVNFPAAQKLRERILVAVGLASIRETATKKRARNVAPQ